MGDQSHGCELVLRFANSVFEIGAYESGLYAEQATEAWNHELVRIDSTTFEVTHVAMVDRADRFLAHGQNLYFEQNGGIYELPLAGGPPRYLTAASKRVGVYVYVVADGHIYVPENGGGVRQVALDTGVSTTLWPDHGIGALWVGDEHFFVQVEYPDFDLRRAPRAAPDSLEVIDGDTFLSAEFFHWNTDPDHLYVIESGSYYSLDMTSGALKELSRSVGYTAAKAENFILSSKSFTVGGREETHVMALPRRGGELQLVDNAEADHITALGDYAYLVRDDALLRIPL